jgi:hypothetical protein
MNGVPVKRLLVLCCGAMTFLASGAATAETPDFGVAPRGDARCGTIHALGEGLAGAMEEMAYWGMGITTTLVPHLGAWSSLDSTGLMVSWPLQWSFGTVTGEEVLRRRCGPNNNRTFHAHRVLVEPAITIPFDEATVFGSVRPGYRFVYHGTESMWGFGAGVGATTRFAPFEVGAGPELILQYGECCSPGYADLAVRYERFFESEADALTVSIGFSYF